MWRFSPPPVIATSLSIKRKHFILLIFHILALYDTWKFLAFKSSVSPRRDDTEGNPLPTHALKILSSNKSCFQVCHFVLDIAN